MAENDGVMCKYYGDVFLNQLRDHPRLKELQAVLDAALERRPFDVDVPMLPLPSPRHAVIPLPILAPT